MDVLENKKLILKLIMETKEIDKDTKKMMKDFVYVIFKYFRDVKLDTLFEKINKNSQN